MLDPGMPSHIPSVDEFKSIGPQPKQPVPINEFSELIERRRRNGNYTPREAGNYINMAKEALASGGELKVIFNGVNEPSFEIIYRSPVAK